MNKVQKQIYENIVTPAINSLPKTSLARVDSYDVDHNLATVIIDGINSEQGYRRYPNVPVQISQGTKNASVFPGDIVVVDFFDGNGNTPVITGVANNSHLFYIREKYEAHMQAGGEIPDLYKTREGKEWQK